MVGLIQGLRQSSLLMNDERDALMAEFSALSTKYDELSLTERTVHKELKELQSKCSCDEDNGLDDQEDEGLSRVELLKENKLLRLEKQELKQQHSYLTTVHNALRSSQALLNSDHQAAQLELASAAASLQHQRKSFENNQNHVNLKLEMLKKQIAAEQEQNDLVKQREEKLKSLEMEHAGLQVNDP